MFFYWEVGGFVLFLFCFHLVVDVIYFYSICFICFIVFVFSCLSLFVVVFVWAFIYLLLGLFFGLFFFSLSLG